VDEIAGIQLLTRLKHRATSLEELGTDGITLRFHLDDPEFGVGILALTSAAAVNMTYDITVNGSDAASSTTTTPAATSVVPAKSGASRMTDPASLICLSLLSIAAFVVSL
jgi:hypothetical protein